LNSSKPVYSEFVLPATIVHGDIVNIPINVFNNLPSSASLEVTFIEERDDEYFNNRMSNMTIGAK
jgi:hypothetical protein